MKKTEPSERRRRERRQIGKPVNFPFTDSSGCVVPFNRSRQPERRIANYVLSELNSKQTPPAPARPAKRQK